MSKVYVCNNLFSFSFQETIHLVEYNNKTFYLGLYQSEKFKFCNKPVSRGGKNTSLTAASYKLNAKDIQEIDPEYIVMSFQRLVINGNIKSEVNDSVMFKNEIKTYMNR